MIDIKNYEGMYAVTQEGEIWSYKRNKFLKSTVNASGYPTVKLCKDSKEKTYYTHRLVAEALIPNPKKYPQVNHKDENKLNHHPSNLEWCDSKYNNNYGTRTERMAEAHRGMKYNKKVAA